MDRLACVDLPAFGLQLVRRRHPDWAGLPAAVVSEEAPNGEILAVCERALRLGVLPGLRYGAALSLSPELRAAAVPPHQLDEGARHVAACLRRFSPEVEPAPGEPGTFFIDGSGLGRLYTGCREWGRLMCRALEQEGFSPAAAVGFTRFGVYALAKVNRGVIATRTPDEEAALARQIPLHRLRIPPTVRQGLFKLGVRDVGNLLALPPEQLLERFGQEIHLLHRLAAGRRFCPLQPLFEEEAITEHLELTGPVGDAVALTFIIKGLLPSLLEKTRSRHQRLAALTLTLSLHLDHRGIVEETIRPAEPCLDEAQLIDLVRLFLEHRTLEEPVVEIDLEAHGVKAVEEQLTLFERKPRRDLTAAERAFARLRVAYGPDAVATAGPREGHLPEAGFVLTPMERFRFPEPLPEKREGHLVRRIYDRPVRLQPRPVCGPRGCHLGGMGSEPVSRLHGPSIVSGGWWVKEVVREYHFAETETGTLFWVYFDRQRRCWFQHGEVE